MLKILGVGLPRTGTATLAEALRILGFNTLHHAPERLNLDNLTFDSFRCYDDVDAVVDVPAAHFFENILANNPACKAILTVRHTGRWWESIKWHIDKIHLSADVGHIRQADRLHSLLFGSPWPEEFLYKKAFERHNVCAKKWLVDACVPFLRMDIEAGDKWAKLCSFLGVEEPDAEWPWLNRKVL